MWRCWFAHRWSLWTAPVYWTVGCGIQHRLCRRCGVVTERTVLGDFPCALTVFEPWHQVVH